MVSTDAETQVVDLEVPDERLLSAGASLAESMVGIIDRLGRYVLLDRLGRGAFGLVWAAYDPELDRRVAIKIVHGRRVRGAAGSETRDVLLREAQLLAQLSHPNVVAIHDVGRLEDVLEFDELEPEEGDEAARGVFIVMEHLDGPTLRTWIKGNPDEGKAPRSAAEILRVFGEAGEGLRAAHERGLVHLDFKPGNVMFGSDGRVRVLDFGLARVGRRLATKGESTGRTRVAGTPPYMAPEQHAGADADARADQYAFCVALWEALHGQRPFPGVEADELHVAKLAGPPRPPRGGAAPHLVAALQRGMAVDPEERFESMEALLAVLADDPSLRRRRWVAGAIVVAGLIGAGFGLARAADEQADPCVLPREAVEAVWDEERRAEIEAAFVQTDVPFAEPAFARVAAGLDDYVANWSAVRREVCRASLVEGQVPVEVMSEQVLCLERRLRRLAGVTEMLRMPDPELVARALDSVLALEDPAGCRRTSEPSSGANEHGVASVAVEDAIARAAVHADLGRPSSGLTAAERALELAGELGDLGGTARARALQLRLLLDLGRYDEALAVAGDALSAAAESGEVESELDTSIALVALRAARGEYREALAIHQIIAPRVDPARWPQRAIKLDIEVAKVDFREQRWDPALARLEHARSLAESALGAGDPLLGEIDVNTGNVLVASGRDTEAGARHYAQAVELWTRIYGEHHPALARTRINLSAVFVNRGQLEQAIAVLERALATYELVYEGDHPHVSVCHQNLGAIHSMLGHHDEAIEHIRRSLALSATQLGPEHPDHASFERTLATLLVLEGEHREAMEHRAHAREVYASTLGPGDTRMMAVEAELAESAWWLGQIDEARQHLARAESMMEGADPKDPRRAAVLSTFAQLELAEGQVELAHEHAGALVEFLDQLESARPEDVFRARVQLAGIERSRGELEGARALVMDAQGELPGDHPHAWLAQLELGCVARAAGESQAAEEALERASQLARGELGNPVQAARVALEQAELHRHDNRERAAKLASEALAILSERGLRPDLRERAVALGGSDEAR